MQRPAQIIKLKHKLRVTECENCDNYTISNRACPGCGKIYCGRCDATELSRQNSFALKTYEELRAYTDRVATCNDCNLSNQINDTHISNKQTE